MVTANGHPRDIRGHISIVMDGPFIYQNLFNNEGKELTNKFQVASTQTMNTFHLVLADDAVPKCTACLDQEHSIGIATLAVAARA